MDKEKQIAADGLRKHPAKYSIHGASHRTHIVTTSISSILERIRFSFLIVSFDGYVVLEYEGDVDNPVPALEDCVEAVRKEATNG